jgi:hypothetical protein
VGELEGHLILYISFIYLFNFVAEYYALVPTKQELYHQDTPPVLVSLFILSFPNLRMTRGLECGLCGRALALILQSPKFTPQH